MPQVRPWPGPGDLFRRRGPDGLGPLAAIAGAIMGGEQTGKIQDSGHIRFGSAPFRLLECGIAVFSTMAVVGAYADAKPTCGAARIAVGAVPNFLAAGRASRSARRAGTSATGDRAEVRCGERMRWSRRWGSLRYRSHPTRALQPVRDLRGYRETHGLLRWLAAWSVTEGTLEIPGDAGAVEPDAG